MFASITHEDNTPITLGELRELVNKQCENLNDSTPITIWTELENKSLNCVQILGDAESIEFYAY